MEFFIILAIFLISLTLHEIAHGAAAYALGDDTAKVEGRLSLNPLAHFEPFLSVILPAICLMSGMPILGGAKPVPVNPRKFKNEDWGMALVALAGPLTNLILAFVAYGAMMIFNINTGIWALILANLTRINLALMLFNLLPFPPLDGSKIIYPLAPEFVQDFFKKMERNPLLVFAFVMIFTTQIGNLMGLGMEAILNFWTLIFK